MVSRGCAVRRFADLMFLRLPDMFPVLKCVFLLAGLPFTVSSSEHRCAGPGLQGDGRGAGGGWCFRGTGKTRREEERPVSC